MIYQLEINPRDVLFFRDAKPIGASAEGCGAYWPLPSVLYSAFISALSLNLGEKIESWESRHTKREGENDARFHFGGLRTWGPFPMDENKNIYVPTPADLLPHTTEEDTAVDVLRPTEIKDSCSNLPEPLIYPVASMVKPNKSKLGEWISLSEFEKYLRGEYIGIKTKSSSDFYIAEARPGIEISPESRTTKKSQFYSAEYLRLKENIAITAFAECIAKKAKERDKKDVIAEFFSDSAEKNIILGGQSGLAYVTAKRNAESKLLPWNLDCEIANTTRLKWTLISPAYFGNGWMPSWINMPCNGERSYDVNLEIGSVMLKEQVERGSMTRSEWREKINHAPRIKAKLAAAKVQKPLIISGWKLDKTRDNAGGMPKNTKLLVPAGSVYYFECETENDCKQLAKILNGNTKSDMYGERGFGLGLCSTWELQKI